MYKNQKSCILNGAVATEFRAELVTTMQSIPIPLNTDVIAAAITLSGVNTDMSNQCDNENIFIGFVTIH